MIAQKLEEVSVPLRGLWFLSFGDFNINDEYFSCFRPLAGIMVLIPSEKTSRSNSVYVVVSVPLRGLWFLSVISYALSMIRIFRFRPLAGIMVLITFFR